MAAQCAYACLNQVEIKKVGVLLFSPLTYRACRSRNSDRLSFHQDAKHGFCLEFPNKTFHESYKYLILRLNDFFSVSNMGDAFALFFIFS